MTRWTFFLILKDRFIGSVEFNWDMYPEWYWDKAFKMLNEVIDENSFKKMVMDFNSQAHNYNDDVMFWEWGYETIEKSLDMSKWYYDFWFSDWIFIKNMSWQKIVFKVKDYESWEKVKYRLKDWGIVRFYFGQVRKESEKILTVDSIETEPKK